MDCYRDMNSVLLGESELTRMRRQCNRKRGDSPSGHKINTNTIYSGIIEKGGVTPYNVLLIPNTFGNSGNNSHAGSYGHGAGTPLELADWWTRYICPTGGTVLDMFAGSGTMGIAAIDNGCSFIGIEKMPNYADIAKQRIGAATMQQPLLTVTA
jgi:site-specific DNA-methyltransferase (adenine-specific)